MYFLVAYFFFDVLVQEAGGETRILRFFEDETCRRLDRKLVELPGRRAVVQAADSLGRDPHDVDVRKVRRAARDRPDDIVYIDRLVRSVSLTDPHCRLGY